jgi:beta-glucosidase
VSAGKDLKIAADVTNTGDRAGDEVVQLYVSHLNASVPVPIRSLAGVQRLFLKPGEKRTVTFTLSPEQMSVIDDNGGRLIEPGEFLISVGGKQPGFSGYADARSSGVVTTRFSVTGKLFVR